MEGFKFDPEKMEKLNNPERLNDIPPDFIWEKLDVQNPGTVVDLGAGTGFFSVRFAGMANVDKVYALDIAEVMVDYMKENIVPMHDKIEAMKMDESSIPLPDDIAGVLVMINLHHELHEPLKILQESARVLNPGGKLAIIDWKKKETEQGPPVNKRYNTETIHRQLEEAPFRSVKAYDEMPDHFLVVAENIND